MYESGDLRHCVHTCARSGMGFTGYHLRP